MTSPLSRFSAPQKLSAGIRAILVHAISERAKDFYLKAGFIPSPVDPMTLMITLYEAAKELA